MTEHISTERQGNYHYTILLDEEAGHYHWEVTRVRWSPGPVQVGHPTTIAEGRATARDAAISQAQAARQKVMVENRTLDNQ